jgi:hypothetical protein
MPRTNTIQITEGLICPCCGQPTRRQWDQPSWKPTNPPLSQTDCTNPACAGFYMTLSIEAFFEKYAQTKLQSKE